MSNGKFFAGLPPKMMNRATGVGPNRQQSNFFWPDESKLVPVSEVKCKTRRGSQTIPTLAVEKPKIETKELFKNEFSNSKIQFNDVPAKSPKGREAYASRIEFYDFEDDLNNVPKTDKNFKKDVERNRKNSPKLQDKRLSFDEDVGGIKIIENDVKSVRISDDTRRNNSGNGRENGQRNVGRFKEEESPPRWTESRSKRNVRVEFDEDRFDGYDDHDYPQTKRTQVHRYEDEYHEPELKSALRKPTIVYPKSPLPRHRIRDDQDSCESSPPPPSLTNRKEHILKVDRITSATSSTSKEGSQQHSNAPTQTSTPTTSRNRSHKHLVSNINFYDNDTVPATQTRNVRSSAVMRVSVGLPDF